MGPASPASVRLVLVAIATGALSAGGAIALVNLHREPGAATPASSATAAPGVPALPTDASPERGAPPSDGVPDAGSFPRAYVAPVWSPALPAWSDARSVNACREEARR